VDAISDAATKFSAFEFFTERAKISAQMEESLQETLSKTVYTDVVFFQLRSVDLPDDYEKAIQHTEVTKQEIHKAEAERGKNLIVYQTNVEVASIRVAINKFQAQGEAEKLKLLTDAKADTFVTF